MTPDQIRAEITRRWPVPARTEFVRRSEARALTPRGLVRLAALRDAERLLTTATLGLPLGTMGYLLNSFTGAFPVSTRAIEAELTEQGPWQLVEVAERVELGLWRPPEWQRRVPEGSDEAPD